MSVFDKLEKTKGGYIFLSHSHADIDKVRQIRNSLEEQGFEPLCFYLKCLNDDSEIEDLIKREIDAREWFVFVNSENSRRSKWVTLEREYITRTDSKKILTVDVDDAKSVSDAIHRISHNLRVFLARSGADHLLAGRIAARLEAKDYLVFFENPAAGTNRAMKVIKNAIVEASKDGCVIALLTARSVQSVYVAYEIQYAIRKGGNVIPVVIGDVALDEDFRCVLAGRQLYYLSENPTDDEIDEMIEKISRTIVR